MHHFIFPSKDSWISSGSNTRIGTIETDQNFGQDEVLEIKKEFEDLSFKYQTRALVQFDLSEVSKSIISWNAGNRNANDIPPPSTLFNRGKSRWFLRLYESEGNRDLSTEYKLAGLPISESWDEGRGKFGVNPKITDGCSWKYKQNPDNGAAIYWKNPGPTNTETGSGASVITGSGNVASQSFSYQSPDIEMDVTDVVDKWISGSINNNGLLIRFSGSQETDATTFGNLKFFSRNTHTIYAPKLEVRWDDHNVVTGSVTGSLTELTMSGLADNYVYPIGLREFYRESETAKFRFGARKRYIQKSFSTSVQTATGSFISEGSSSYSIRDVATDETIIPFSAYTSMSCDSKSNYFIQKLNGLYPDRVYKILLKLKYDDGQEHIIDDNFEFIIKR